MALVWRDIMRPYPWVPIPQPAPGGIFDPLIFDAAVFDVSANTGWASTSTTAPVWNPVTPASTTWS